MEELHKQVARARWLLGMQRFLKLLGWCWFGTTLLALAVIVVGRFYPLPVATWGWLAGALGIGLAATLIWLVATARKPVGAALEIDRRFKLKERVSSALVMSPEDRRTDLGQALVEDAVRRVGRVDVSQEFEVAPPRQILLPLVPGAVVLLVVLLSNPAVVAEPKAPEPEAVAANEPVKQSADTLRRELAARREKAEQENLDGAKELIRKLEEGTKELSSGKVDRQKALAKLNDLTREAQKRRQKFGTAEQVRKQFSQLKDIQQGPAESFAKAVARGDFQKAADELQQLRQQLANSQLNDQQKQALADQLEKMQQKLNKLAEAQQAAGKELKSLEDRADKLRNAGQTAEANKLQQQIDKLLDQVPKMQNDQLDELAEKLGRCSKCLRQGQGSDAAQALGDLQTSLGDLQKQLDEMEMLDDVMSQMAQARDQMGCSQCNGGGCNACQGDKPGVGMGPGRGQGPRPKAKDDVDFYNRQERKKLGPGGFVLAGTAEGANRRGDGKVVLKEEVDATRRSSADPLTDHRIPRGHREHTREYFNRFREGK